MTRTVALLGSTGSVGTQAVDVLTAHRDRFQVTALSAGGANPALLAEQAVRLGVGTVAIADPRHEDALRQALAAAGSTAAVLAGPQAAAEIAGDGHDVVLNAITGSVGLVPTLEALGAGSTLALANKESLVVGGPVVKAAVQRPGQIVPVDSEHSAMAQAMRAGKRSELRRLILTASGGPFFGWSAEETENVSVEQALAHPTWNMGPVITINSATLVNKGLELIEAHLLFDVPVSDITVVVHRQSVVHSMAEFIDGSTLAQAAPADMREPIAHALAWPDRLPGVVKPCDWTAPVAWTFEPLDESVYPAVRLARQVAISGGTYPAVYNAANEQAVAAFLSGSAPFGGILRTIESVLDSHDGISTAAVTLSDVLAAESWARARADEVLMRS